MDDALRPASPSAPWPARGTADRNTAATAPTRPRPRGPVLMGDLTGTWGGRPLLLSHWDEDEPR